MSRLTLHTFPAPPAAALPLPPLLLSRTSRTLPRPQVVGQLMITFEWSDWRNANMWWIQSVYVSPHARRRGHFKLLYAHVRNEAMKAGAAGLRLYAGAVACGCMQVQWRADVCRLAAVCRLAVVCRCGGVGEPGQAQCVPDHEDRLPYAKMIALFHSPASPAVPAADTLNTSAQATYEKLGMTSHYKVGWRGDVVLAQSDRAQGGGVAIHERPSTLTTPSFYHTLPHRCLRTCGTEGTWLDHRSVVFMLM